MKNSSKQPFTLPVHYSERQLQEDSKNQQCQLAMQVDSHHDSRSHSAQHSISYSPSHSATNQKSCQKNEDLGAFSSYKQKLLAEKSKFMMLQSQVRYLNKKVSMERQLLKNKRLLEKLERQLEVQQDLQKQKKKAKILSRILDIEAQSQQRKKFISESDQTVLKLKQIQSKKQQIIDQILQHNKKQYEICYHRALEERRKLLRPMDFEDLNEHSRKYVRLKHEGRRFKTQTKDEQICTANKNEKKRVMNFENPEVSSKNSYKNMNSAELKKSQVEKSQPVWIYKSSNVIDRISQAQKRFKNMTDRSVIRSSVEVYGEMRKKEQQRIYELKDIISKRKQYGNRVQKEFFKNRIKTDVTQKQKERSKAESDAQEEIERNKIIKNMKKPQIPFTINVDAGTKNEVSKIKRSNNSPQQKLFKLNQMMEAQSYKIKMKGNSGDLERLNMISMARAQILLGID